MQGEHNAAADDLSHLRTNALHTDNSSPVVDFRALALAKVDDPDLARLRSQSQSSLRLEDVPLVLSDGVSIVCNVST